MKVGVSVEKNALTVLKWELGVADTNVVEMRPITDQPQLINSSTSNQKI